MHNRYLYLSLMCILIVSLASGCTVIFQKGRRSDIEKISELSQKIDKLSRSKEILEDRLRDEIDAKEVNLSMQDRGLVVTFISEVLFDSGKAVLKPQAFRVLDKVISVLQDTASGLDVGVEGHTDNQPIKVSKWESNWDLSGARARNVLNYLIKQGVDPHRLSFSGYGEYTPVATNNTKEGRQQNRRVEIVILPNVVQDRDAGSPGSRDNLK